MAKFIKLGLLAGLLFVAGAAQASKNDKYAETIANFKNTAAGKSFFSTAYGYAVFPTVGKGGFVIGGAHGKGRVYRQGTAVGKTSVSQLSVGLQAGGQTYSQIIFFEDKRAFEDFTSGNFEFGADASAMMANARAAAQASTTGKSANTSSHPTVSTQTKYSYYKGMAVLTVGKAGLMFEASLSGQKYSYKPL